MRTAEQTALLIALLFKRSEQRQARLGMNTIRFLSKRRHIRSVFVRMLAGHLDDLGVILMEIDGDGFGLIAASALTGAPMITAKADLLTVLDQLQQDKIGFSDIRDELGRDIATDAGGASRTCQRPENASQLALTSAEHMA